MVISVWEFLVSFLAICLPALQSFVVGEMPQVTLSR